MADYRDEQKALVGLPLQIVYKIHDIEIPWSKIRVENNLSPRVITEIQNAWRNCAVVDNLGYVWISNEGIKSILRLSKKGNSYNYFIDNKISDVDKRIIEGKKYIRGIAIGKMLDENIQGNNSTTKRNYSKYSQNIYIDIVRNPYLENLRFQAAEAWKAKRLELKRTRLKNLKIERDELTNDPLVSDSHFAHIRSVEMFPDLSLLFWNGLILNPDVHAEISKKNVQDEKMLNELCKKNKWSTKWLRPFRLELRRYGLSPLI